MKEAAGLPSSLSPSPPEGEGRGEGCPPPAKHGRSLTGFYVAMGIVIALTLFGTWFWKTWNVWWFDAAEAKRRQSEAAAQLGLSVEKEINLGDGVKLELVLIPAGRFRMGSMADQAERECGDETLHWVVITQPFCIGKHEVTQEVWEKVMGTNPSRFKRTKNPVENVSWDDCQAFLKRLNGLGKEKGRFRLPTEAEWEWACRAGTKTRFCFGDNYGVLPSYAWCYANSGGTTHPVGMKKPNAWGLHDMHGNVQEWCGDWYGTDYYAQSPRYDPTGPATGLGRILRGGSWANVPRVCRSSDRFWTDPWINFDFGFRVVLAPAAP